MQDRDRTKQAEYWNLQISASEVPNFSAFNSQDFEETLVNKLPSYYCKNEDFDTPAYNAFGQYLGIVQSEAGPEILPHIKRAMDKLAFPLKKGWLQDISTIGQVRRMSSAVLEDLGLSEGEQEIVRKIFPPISI